MANFIPCDEIDNRVDALKQKFEPCYMLTAADLDEVMDLLYSASLCGTGDPGGAFDQNNIVSMRLTNSGVIQESNIVTAINTGVQFEVDEKELLIFVHNYTANSGTTYKTDVITEYWLLKTGKGTYGSGGTQIQMTNLFFLRNNTTGLPIVPGQSQSPIVYNLFANTVGGATLSTPHLVLNGQPDSFTIANTQDVYFMIYTTEFQTDDTSFKLYRFVGDPGNYGSGPDDSILADFVLVQTNNDGVPTDNGIKIREITVPAIIYSAGAYPTLADAVNNSFTQEINVGPYELVWLITDEVENSLATPTGTTNIVTKKYSWKNGIANNINGGTATASDFALVEVLGSTTVTSPGKTNPGEVYYIEWPTVATTADIVDAINSLSGADRVVLDDNLVLVKVTVDDGGKDYKIYEFTGTTGGNGTYGVAGLTAVVGDLNATPVVDSDTVPTVLTAGDVLYDDSTTLLNVSNVQEAIEALGAPASGFETIDEGNGDGLAIIGRTAANYGNLGLRALDGSFNPSASGTRGATGDYSVALGHSPTASGDYSAAIGYQSIASGDYSFATGNSTASGLTSFSTGGGNTSSGQRAMTWGQSNTASSNQATAWGNLTLASAFMSTAWGTSTVASGSNSSAAGVGGSAYSFGEFVVGTYSTIYAPADASSFNSADRAFIIGIGASSGARADGAIFYKSGDINLSSLEDAMIDSADAYSAITKGYFQNNWGHLLQIDEGNGNGYILRERTAANYGNIGLESIDFSYHNAASSTHGATGDYAFASGYSSIASGDNSAVIGGFAGTSSGANSIVAGGNTNVAGGLNSGVYSGSSNTISSSDRSVIVGGSSNTITSADYTGIFAGTSSSITAIYGTVFGSNSSVVSGQYGITIGGSNLEAYSAYETVLGRYSTTYTPVSSSTWQAADRLFVVGNGTSSGTRSNALTLYKNGGMDIKAFIKGGTSLFLNEQNVALTNQAGYGQFWVKDDVPNIPMFSDDAGTDFELATIDANGVYRTKVSLTASQLKSIGTTPIELIPAPGAGKIINPIRYFASFNWGSVAFDTNDLIIETVGSSSTLATTAIVDDTADVIWSAGFGGGNNALVANAAVQIRGTDSVASGDSTIDVYIIYEIITL